MDFPGLRISVNGGIKSLRETDEFLGLRPVVAPAMAEASAGAPEEESKCSMALTTPSEEAALALLSSQKSAGGTSGSAARQLVKKGVKLSQNGMGPDQGTRWQLRPDVAALHLERKQWAAAESARRRVIHDERSKAARAARESVEAAGAPGGADAGAGADADAGAGAGAGALSAG